MGVFDFLLHRSENDDGGAGDDGGTREVMIGMTLEPSGKFAVSVFDERDPEHRERRRRHLREKASLEKNDDGDAADGVEGYYEEEEGRTTCSGTEAGLVVFCVVLFALYVAARVAFSDIDVMAENDEL